MKTVFKSSHSHMKTEKPTAGKWLVCPEQSDAVIVEIGNAFEKLVSSHTQLVVYNSALRSENSTLRAALEKIHGGDTMRGVADFTHTDVIQKHYAICRAALAETV